MLGKGKCAIVLIDKEPWHPNRNITVIEYCETPKEGFDYIKKQKKRPGCDWDVMVYAWFFSVPKS